MCVRPCRLLNDLLTERMIKAFKIRGTPLIWKRDLDPQCKSPTVSFMQLDWCPGRGSSIPASRRAGTRVAAPWGLNFDMIHGSSGSCEATDLCENRGGNSA